MVGKPAQAFEQRRAIDAVVAAYAGAPVGHAAFARALTALRRALPRARLWLLCPDGARLEAHDEDGMIIYPTPGGDAHADAAAREATLRAVDLLSVCGAQAALVFTERGFAPFVPAYLCYLAGIGYRAGVEEEFGGAVLSPAVRISPCLDGVERHLALLAAVGLAPAAAPKPGTIDSTTEGYGCDR